MKARRIVAAAVALSSCAVSAEAQPTAFDRAWECRNQIGLSPTDLAAIGVNAQTQDQLTTLVRDSLQSAGTVSDAGPSPVDAIDGLTQAERALTEAVSWGRDPREALDRLRAARAALIEALQPLTDAARDTLPEQLRPYVARAVANAGIDSPYRLLDLTAEQRAKVTALQEQRDRVTRDARQWHRLKHLAAVQDRFAKEVRGLLTTEQQAELDRLNRNVEANLDAVWQVELAAYPAPEAAGTGWGAIGEWAGPFLADARAFLSRARTVLDRLTAALAALDPSRTPPAPTVAAANPVFAGPR